MSQTERPDENGLAPRESEEEIVAASTNMEFKCDHCSSVFGRQEHLTRHKRSHTREKPFTCSTCGKSFSRLDVLTRHIASHQEIEARSWRRGASARACQECAVSRTRCSRDHPCRRCSNRGLKCSYPAPRSQRESSNRRNESPQLEPPSEDMDMDILDEPMKSSYEIENQPLETDSHRAVATLPQEQSEVTEVMMFSVTDAEIAPAGEHISDPANWVLPSASQETRTDGHVGNPNDGKILDEYIAGATFMDQLAGISTINWLSPPYYTDFDSTYLQFSADGAYHHSDTVDQHNISDVTGPIINTPWLNLLEPDLTPNYEPSVTSVSESLQLKSNLGERARENEGSSVASAKSVSTPGAYYVNGAPTRAPFKGRPVQGRLSTSFIHELSQDSDSTGSSTTHTSDSTLDTSAALITSETYNNLVAMVKQISPQRRMSESIQFPSLANIRICFQFYFRRFHPAYPFLPKSQSVYELQENWLLLLAVCAVGSRYTRSKASRSSRETLSFLLGDAVSSLTSDGPNNDVATSGASFDHITGGKGFELTIIQTTLLHIICKLHTGKGDTSRSCLIFRHFLVDSCHKLGLLEFQGSTPAHSQNHYEEESVQSWVERQARIRAGLMIWIFDSMLSLELNKEPLLKLGDAKGPMPCIDSIWDNPDIEAITQADSKLITLPEAVEMLYMEKKLPGQLGDFGTLVLIHAIHRRTNEATYQHQSRLSSWVPSAEVSQRIAGEAFEETWPPSVTILSRWRNSACDCLDLLHWNANSIIAKAGGWEHPMLLHLHLSRLHLLTPLAHMRTLAAAASSRALSISVETSKVDKARFHVSQWVIRDQYKARLSLIHAGAILWHVRRYSVNNFLEPFGIFAATLVVWSYSTMMNFLKRNNRIGQEQANDRSPHISNGEAAPLEAFGETPLAEAEEEPEPVFLHIDRPCDDEMVQTYVRLGHKMAGHMSKVGDICQEGAPRRILREGIRMLMGGAEQPLQSEARENGEKLKGGQVTYAWGIEQPYLELLRGLVRSSAD